MSSVATTFYQVKIEMSKGIKFKMLYNESL